MAVTNSVADLLGSTSVQPEQIMTPRTEANALNDLLTMKVTEPEQPKKKMDLVSQFLTDFRMGSKSAEEVVEQPDAA